jgi:nucleotide-binding universal stress UspA family protein
VTLFRHIIYPVDFSPRCLSVRPYVAALALRTQAQLILVHAIPIPQSWFSPGEAPLPPPIDMGALEREAKASMDRLASDPLFKGLPVTSLVSPGDPAQIIIDAAAEHPESLIMIPTHGYGKFRTLLLGSVTSKVLHDAHCPVWTDSHVEDPQTALHAEPRRILCALGLDGKDDSLIAMSRELAGGDLSLIRLMHAVAVEEARPQKYFGAEFDRFLMDTAKERVAELQRKLDLHLEVTIRGGPVAAVVRQTALLQGTDLVVIGRGLAQSPLGRLRTNAYAIIREAPCPVLSV